jgi:glycosyltransferase involved in cell wall biosynthesis
MKIAIISSSFFPVIDGVTIAVFNRVKQLSSLGYSVQLFCPDYSAIKHIYPNWQEYTGEIFPGVTVINLPSTESIGLDFERDVTSKSYQIVDRELAAFQPDLIHVDEPERLATRFLQVPGVKFAKQQQIPCVAFFHTNYLEYFDDYFKLPLGLNKIIKNLLGRLFVRIYNEYNLTLTASKVTEKKLKQMNIKNVRFDELLGVDNTKFDRLTKEPDFFAKTYYLPQIDQQIKLIFIGRLTPDKGWDFALKSFTELQPEIIAKIAFIIIGDGPMKQEIETSLSKLTSQVYLLRRVSPSDIPAILTNSDIFITNSEKETKGLAVMEALAAGIVAIAPCAGGIIDTIDDGETGMLYQPQNHTDFLNKLTLLISDSDLRQSIGLKAREIIHQGSWQKTNNNLIRIWWREIWEARKYRKHR